MQFVLLRNMESISIPLHLFIALIVSPTIAGILILLDLPPKLFQHFESSIFRKCKVCPCADPERFFRECPILTMFF